MEKATHVPYDPEFRTRAVELVRIRGLPRAQVARDLGVNVETLRLWVKQAEIDAGQRAGLTTDEKAELVRLRREVAALREEREIPKQAARFSEDAHAPRRQSAAAGARVTSKPSSASRRTW
jgi:transposase